MIFLPKDKSSPPNAYSFLRIQAFQPKKTTEIGVQS